MASLKFRHYATESDLRGTGTIQAALNAFDVGTIVFIDSTQKQYIITSKTNNVVTYKIYYGEPAVVSVSGSGAARTLTWSDGREETVTINDVDHATSADVSDTTKSVAWANVTGKPNIVTTDTEQTISGSKIFNNNTTFHNETDIESLTTDSLLVTGSARFTNTINGNLKGNVEGNLTGIADTAKTAAICTGNSATATALTTSAGSTNTPVYFTGGKPSPILIQAGSADVERPFVVITDNNELYKTSGITANYSKKSITATTFKGNLEGNASTATTASSCSGNAATATKATTAVSLGSGALKHMCSLHAMDRYNAYKIVTDWNKSDNIMPTINIRGYAYGTSGTIDCDIVIYHFNNASCNYSITNKGSYPIRVWQNIENDVQVFYISPGEYYGMFNVFVYSGARTNLLTKWSMTPVSEVSGTEISCKPIATNITGNAATATIASSCSGNAGTATKLETARTLWGQSFNGSGNVSGSLKDVTTLTASGDITGGNIKSNGVIFSNNYNTAGNTAVAGFVFNKGGDYFGIGPSSGSVSNVGFGTTTGINGIWKSELMTITNSGNVGIGTTSPTSKLHVAGAGYFTGDISSAANIIAGGYIKGETVKISSGCTLEYDSTQKCVKFVFS